MSQLETAQKALESAQAALLAAIPAQPSVVIKVIVGGVDKDAQTLIAKPDAFDRGSYGYGIHKSVTIGTDDYSFGLNLVKQGSGKMSTSTKLAALVAAYRTAKDVVAKLLKA
jgi:hypothetical protein